MAVTLQELLVRLGLDAGDFGKGMDKAMSTTTSFGAHVDSVVDKILSPAGMIGALAAIGATAFSAAEMLDESFDTIITRTGATGAALDALKGSFGAVYGNVPSDAAAVTEAISGLNVRLGLTGKPLEDLSVQFLNFARITGTDVQTAVTSVTRVFGDWKVAADQQSGTLDFLFRTSQATGIGVTALSDSLTRFGAPLRQMGFDLETSAALLGKFQQEGVNTDRVLATLNIALANMAKAGINDTSVALQMLVDQIKNAGTASEANRIALEVFGSRAGPQMASAIREGRFEIGGLLSDLKESGVTINATAAATDDFGQRWKKTWHAIQLAIAPVGEALRVFLDFAAKGFARLIKWTTPLFTFLIGGLQRIAEWLGKIPGMSKVFADTGEPVKDLAKQIETLKKHTVGQTVATDDLKNELGKLDKDGLKKAGEATKQYEKELRDWKKAADDAAKAAGDNWSALYKLREETKKAQEQTTLYGQGLIRVGKETQNYIDEAYALRDSLGAIESAARGAKDMMPPFSKAISDAIGMPGPAVNKFGEAMKALGLDSIAAKQEIAKQMAIARDEVLGNKLSTDFMKQTAIYRALKAQIEAAEEAGEKIPEEQRATLEKLESLLNVSANKQKGVWGDLSREISTIFNDLTASLGKAFLSIFGIGVDNKALKKQEQDLRTSLVERTKEWEDYQANYVLQLEMIRTAAAKELEGELADIQANVAEKQKEYDDYVSEVTARISELRNESKANLEEELSDLREGLAEKTREYENYQADIHEQLQEARDKYRETLEERSADLQEALSDGLRDYEAFVEDVNTRLSRLGVDHKESIEDETRETNRGIADKKKSYARDTKEIQKKIDRELAKGEKANQENIEDWRETLREKQEDLEEYIREAGEDLEEFKSDQQRRMDREEEDLRTSLDRRALEWMEYQNDQKEQYDDAVTEATKAFAKEEQSLLGSLADRKLDYDAYQAEVKLKIDTLPGIYATALAKEEADLLTSLTNKKTELDLYKTDATQKAEDLRVAIKGKLTDQETDLAASLATQKADYDKFVTDVETKLDELQGENSVWSRIKKAGVEAFDAIAQAVARIAIDTLLIQPITKALAEGLFKSLGEAISGAFGGIFGGGGGTSVPTGGGPTPTPDDTGGGGGVPGGGGSSLQDPLAWVNAAANVISAIWNIRQEGTMNSVEKNTRYAMLFNLAMLDKINTYLPKLNDIHDRWIEYLRDHTWRIHDVWEVLTQIRDDIRYDLLPPVRFMAGAAGWNVNVYVTLDGKALTSSVMTEVADTLRSGGQQL